MQTWGEETANLMFPITCHITHFMDGLFIVLDLTSQCLTLLHNLLTTGPKVLFKKKGVFQLLNFQGKIGSFFEFKSLNFNPETFTKFGFWCTLLNTWLGFGALRWSTLQPNLGFAPMAPIDPFRIINSMWQWQHQVAVSPRTKPVLDYPMAPPLIT